MEALWLSTYSSNVDSCTCMCVYHLNDLVHTGPSHLSCCMQQPLRNAIAIAVDNTYIYTTTTASDNRYCNCT